MRKALSALTIAAFVLVPFAGHQLVSAAAGDYQISGSVTNQSGLNVDIGGVASANPYTAQENQQFIGVDWGDGSPVEVLMNSTEMNITTPGVGGVIGATNWTGSHAYTSSGPYSILVKIYHQNFEGNESSSASLELDIVIEESTTGTIVIEKSTSAEGENTEFDFTGDLGDFGLFGNTSTSTEQEAGNEYVITELDEDGWTLDSISCTGDSEWATSTDSVSISLIEDDTITCTFTNSETPPDQGRIDIRKEVTEGSATTTQFLFEASWLDLPQFLTDNSAIGTTTNPGVYSATETVPVGWTLESITCSVEGQSTFSTTTNSVSIDLAPGDAVSCTFLNDQDEEPPRTADISGMKWDDVNGDGDSAGEAGLEGWLISLFEEVGTSTTLVATTTTDTFGNYMFDDALEGNYRVCEENRASWMQTFPELGTTTESASCDNGTTGYSIDLAGGQDRAGLDFGNMFIEDGPQCELVDLVIVSDSETQVDEGNATSTFEHDAWTADDDITGATWIWSSFFVEDPATTTVKTFTRTFSWTGDTNISATLDIASDNSYEFSINGNPVGGDAAENNFATSTWDSYDVSSEIVEGQNTLEFTVTNEGGDDDPEANPAGLLYKLTLEGENCEVPSGDDDDDDDSSTSGGGGGGLINSGDDDDDDDDSGDDDDDDDDDSDDGEVLGEDIELPDEDDGEVLGEHIGLPNTGAGGGAQSTNAGAALALTAVLGALLAVREKLVSMEKVSR